MHRSLLALALLPFLLVPARAEEETIPIDVASFLAGKVTNDQLTWIRTWLKDHVHPDDLQALEVDVDNRTHPSSLVAAEARWPAREAGTYSVQRYVRFQHESWDPYGDGYGFEGAMKTGPWRVLDTYRVERVFPLGDTKKLLALSDDVSYAEVHALLQAIQARAVEFGPEASVPAYPKIERISWISREGDLLNVVMTDPDDDLQGTWCKGVLQDGKFLVRQTGMWIS